MASESRPTTGAVANTGGRASSPIGRSRKTDWLERLDHEVSESVKCHLVSDVPFGAFLSGGIDSSIVAYHMSRHLSQPVQDLHDRLRRGVVRRSAARPAKSHKAIGRRPSLRRSCTSTSTDLLDDLIFKLARHYGEPFADSSAIPTYCVSAMARSHVKMVLSGDGGDELFAGYNTYPAILRGLIVEAGPGPTVAARVLAEHGDDLRDRALAPPTPAALAQHGLSTRTSTTPIARHLYQSGGRRRRVDVHDRHVDHR